MALSCLLRNFLCQDTSLQELIELKSVFTQHFSRVHVGRKCIRLSPQHVLNVKYTKRETKTNPTLLMSTFLNLFASTALNWVRTSYS